MKDKILKPLAFLNNILSKGHHRSVKAKKNIIASFFIRGVSIAISLIVVPLTLNYVNPSRYGIWLTLSSIVGWFSFFDIGLSQGLRNKFAEAKAKGDDELAQIYVSTTYAILAIIFFIVWVIFLIVNHFLNWSHILNVSASMESEVSILAIIVFSYFCLQFVFRIITTLILANQESAKSSLIDVIGQIVSLILIIILVKTTQGSLLKLGLVLCLSPLLALVGANLIFFNGVFKKYRPRLSKIKFSYAKGLFNLGMIFFIIQVAGIIQYQTANIIIAQNFGTSDVTSYNIVFKYFGILNMVYVIFLTPFWSASTEAYMKNDIQWIKNGIKKYTQLNILLVVIGCFMLIFSGTLYRLWLGKGLVNIGFYLSLWGFLYFTLTMFAGKYVYFLNGINALRIQFYASIISPFIYVGVSMLLIKYYKLGVYSLFIASIIANFNGYILSPLQYYLVINKNKKGSGLNNNPRFIIVMKILYDYQMFSIQKFGGITRYFCEIIKNLPPDIQFELALLSSENHHLKENREVFKKVNILPEQNFKGKYYLQKIISSINKSYSQHCISTNKFDLFHPTFYDNYFFKYLKKKYIITVHDLILFKFDNTFYKSDPRKIQMENVIKNASRIIAISENTKKDIVEFFKINPEKIDVIHHGFITTGSHERVNNFGKYILFVGQRSRHKNFITFANAN